MIHGRPESAKPCTWVRFPSSPLLQQNFAQKSPAAEDFVNNVIAPLAEQEGREGEFIAVDGAAPEWTAAVATTQAADAEMFWG